MAHLQILDYNGDAKAVLVASGDGTTTTPFISTMSFLSGAYASGSVASGAFASGSLASGALASGSIAAGAIVAGATSIADNEDAVCAGGDRGVKMLVQQLATPADSAADGDYSFPQMSAGRIWVDASGKTLTVASHAVTNAGTFAVQPGPTTTGGCLAYSALSASAVLSAEIKSSAGQVYGMQAFNLNAAARYVRIYNQTGAPASTDAANIVWRGIIPGATTGQGFVVPLAGPIACGTGIGIRATTGIADNDTGALSASELTFNVQYK